ncbi:hypothetical protein PROFUN_03928 [Planoprotostelium fungivorum]|uniref:Mps1 binder-like protein n=1 Tax=Planoprotostelium fungivorum TaxID=1890364 RepID=A0A2P6MTQ5_9EUKA|nr:hypothetical protein PROFUN_03928 [Planoprotostelium fungivorum]
MRDRRLEDIDSPQNAWPQNVSVALLNSSQQMGHSSSSFAPVGLANPSILSFVRVHNLVRQFLLLPSSGSADEFFRFGFRSPSLTLSETVKVLKLHVTKDSASITVVKIPQNVFFLATHHLPHSVVVACGKHKKDLQDVENAASKKTIKDGSKRFDLHKQLTATLGSGDLRGAVKLPPGEDINEWLAVNVIDFFNQINLLYGSIAEFCTPTTCPVMSAGSKYEYLWADDKKVKKPIKVSAPEYADYLMTWVQGILEDESVFPTSDDAPFPKTFKSTVKTIFKKLFRIYAHIYYSHAREIMDLGVEAHLNTAFKHFYLFIREFDLVEEKEMAPLEHTIQEIESKLGEKGRQFAEPEGEDD